MQQKCFVSTKRKRNPNKYNIQNAAENEAIITDAILSTDGETEKLAKILKTTIIIFNQ